MVELIFLAKSILSLKLHYILIIYYLLILRNLYHQLLLTKQSIKFKGNKNKLKQKRRLKFREN
jgi:hypothetical protein